MRGNKSPDLEFGEDRTCRVLYLLEDSEVWTAYMVTAR
jgi:hypothetical protein